MHNMLMFNIRNYKRQLTLAFSLLLPAPTGTSPYHSISYPDYELLPENLGLRLNVISNPVFFMYIYIFFFTFFAVYLLCNLDQVS